MFLNRCQRRNCGKKHTDWALVESYRTARGSRQRVVARLGELRAGEQSGCGTSATSGWHGGCGGCWNWTCCYTAWA